MIKDYEDYMKDLQNFCKKHNSCLSCRYRSDSLNCDTRFLYDEIRKDIIEVEDDLK